MKIWILTTETPWYLPGGIARYVDSFARIAGRAGHAVTVIARGAQTEVRQVADGYTLRSFRDKHAQALEPYAGKEPDGHPAWPYNNMSYFGALALQMADEVEALAAELGPPDIIEVQDYAALGYFLLMRRATSESALQAVPVVVHLHTPDYCVRLLNQAPRYKLPEYWIGRMEMACIRLADAVLSPSQFLAAEIQKGMDGPLEAVTVIPYPQAGNLAGHSAVAAGAARQLLYVGRIELRKGVEPLLAACAQIWAAGEDFQLKMAGGDVDTPLKGGSLRAYLERKYARWIDSGHLQFLGALDAAACAEAMRAATAVLVPSLWENFPNVCIEAMMLGKVVVASRSGGQAEMLGEEGCGILFEHSEAGALADALRQALAMSEAERAALGLRAQARIRRYCDNEAILAARIAHYAAVCAAGARTTGRFAFNNRCLREGPVASPSTADALVSVVIPYYNLGAYLEAALASVLNSTGVDLEVVIVNDGSTEAESLVALERVRAAGDARVRVLDIPNGGLANARNIGAQAARGEILAFVDADDRVRPEFLARAVAVFRRWENVHLVYSWIRYFDGGHGIWMAWNFDLPYLLCHNLLIPIVAVRRESYLRYGRNKPHIVYGLEDYEAWISMAEAGCGGIAIPETLVEYRIREASMFRVIDNDKKLYLYDLIAEAHPQLYAAYGLELFGLQNANGPAHYWDQPTPYLAPIDAVWDRAARIKAERDWLKANNAALRAAEDWHKGERTRLLAELAAAQGAEGAEKKAPVANERAL